MDRPLIQVPSHLLVTSFHVKPRNFDKHGKVKYQQVFEMAPEVFDPKYPYKDNGMGKIDNEFGEYFQLTMFLIGEKLKGEESEWFAFINYLPKEIHTLYTYPDDTKISSSS